MKWKSYKLRINKENRKQKTENRKLDGGLRL